MTLIELLLAATIGLVVVGGAMTVFLGAVRSEPRAAKQVDAIQQARVTAERLTRELRQGKTVDVAKPSELALITYVKEASCGGGYAPTAIACQVRYSCSGDTCTRTVADGSGMNPGPTVVVARNLASPEVFEYDSESGYVGVTLKVDSEAGSPVEIADGVFMRGFAPEEGES